MPGTSTTSCTTSTRSMTRCRPTPCKTCRSRSHRAPSRSRRLCPGGDLVQPGRGRRADPVRHFARAGTYFVQVSAYNGTSLDEPYALRFRTTNPTARSARGAHRPTAGSGALPSPSSLDERQHAVPRQPATAPATYAAQAQGILDAGEASPRLAVRRQRRRSPSTVERRANAYAARFANPATPSDPTTW